MNTKKIVLVFSVFLIAIGVLLYYYVNFVIPTPAVPVEEKKEVTVSTAGAEYNNANIDTAISQTESLVVKDGSNINALLLLATSYAEKGSVAFDETNYGQKAIDTANKVLALDPKNAEAYRIIGYANEIMEKYDVARTNYDKAISLDPKNAQAYSNKGHSYDLQGDLKNAGIWYDKALVINPNEEHSLLNKARLLARQKKFEEAISVLDRLLQTTKNNRFLAEGNQVKAFVFMNKSGPDYESALASIEESLKNDSTVPQAWVTLGLLKLRTLLDLETKEEVDAQIVEAGNAADKALSINKDQASAYYLKALIAQVQGDKVSAERFKKNALEAIPKDITLGNIEKDSLKQTINTVFTSVKSKTVTK